jgi:hypothetical protein
MKLGLDALRTRQRLRIRVPHPPLSFVNALRTGSFRIWVHFRKVRRQALLPIREGLPVSRQEFHQARIKRMAVFRRRVPDHKAN